MSPRMELLTLKLRRPLCGRMETDMTIPEEELHSHTHIDGTVHTHSDGTVHTHSHAHGHTHTQTKAVVNRLARAIGHLESVKRMVEDGRDCSEVLVQLAAVRSALNNTAKIIIKDHIEHCISGAAADAGELAELNDAIDKFI